MLFRGILLAALLVATRGKAIFIYLLIFGVLLLGKVLPQNSPRLPVCGDFPSLLKLIEIVPRPSLPARSGRRRRRDVATTTTSRFIHGRAPKGLHSVNVTRPIPS